MRHLKRPGVTYRNLKGVAIEVEAGLAWRRDNESAVLSAWLDSLDRPTRISSARGA
jgi:hypothetical protein